MPTHESSILITGGTQGMGYFWSLSLARQCPNSLIILTSRTDPDKAATKINTILNQENTTYTPLDLSSLPNYPPLRALVLNAGIQLSGDLEWSDDGIEKTFAINHVGHALLFHLLTPALNSDARIVIVASGVHDPREAWPGLTARYTTAEEVARPGHIAQKESNERDRYVTSKVANVVWMYALARHLELAASKSPGDDKRTAVAFDPGAMPGTKLARNSSAFEQAAIGMLSLCVPVLQKLWRANVHTPTESGEALAWLAMGAEAKGKTGVYFEGRTEKESSEVSKVESKQEELWDWTVGFVGRDGEEKQRFRRCK